MIVVGGEALVDLVIAPDGSVTAVLGGGPFNVARTIGRLGGRVAFLGSISHDRFGTRLLDALVADGVRDELVVRTDAPTTLAAAELDSSGAASYRFYFAGTSAPALERAPDQDEQIDAVHVGTLGLVLEPMATTLTQFATAAGDGVVVMVDPNCRERVIPHRGEYLQRLDHLLAATHVVKISTDDADYLAPGTEPRDLARQLLDRGPHAVLLTAGGAETVIVTRADRRHVPIAPVDVVDTIGAGDAFGGAFLAYWIEAGLGVDQLADADAVAEAAAAANIVAGMTCARVGADPPSRDELPATWGVPA